MDKNNWKIKSKMEWIYFSPEHFETVLRSRIVYYDERYGLEKIKYEMTFDDAPISIINAKLDFIGEL